MTAAKSIERIPDIQASIDAPNDSAPLPTESAKAARQPAPVPQRIAALELASPTIARSETSNPGRHDLRPPIDVDSNRGHEHHHDHRNQRVHRTAGHVLGDRLLVKIRSRLCTRP